jgi:protein-tyrosine phosphatase
MRVLFVCLGNICRSPAFAATLQHMVAAKGIADQFFIDSSGVTSYHLGCHADLRTCHAAKKRGIAIDHIAQVFQAEDFDRFDYIFAVTEEVHHLLLQLTSKEADQSKVFLATHFGNTFRDQEVPDPFYDGEEAFDHVMAMAEDSCEGFLKSVVQIK